MKVPSSKLAHSLRIYLDIALGFSVVAAVLLTVFYLVAPLVNSPGEKSEVAILVAIGDLSIVPVLPADPIFAGFLVLLLAHVWSYGSKLQNEQSLTV